MKKSISLRGFSAYRLWSQLPSIETSHLPDVIMFAAALALFYGVATVGRELRLGQAWIRREMSRPVSNAPR